jgi:hypothetical protein
MISFALGSLIQLSDPVETPGLISLICNFINNAWVDMLTSELPADDKVPFRTV